MSLLAEFIAEARPGRCVMCDEPRRPKATLHARQPLCCASPECRRLYRRLYAAAHQRQRRARVKGGAQ